jgi:hypothetical protein
MADQNPPRPPGSQILFTNAMLHEYFLEAGTRRSMKLCLKCLGETDFLHRVSFLNCKSTCVLCDKRGHIGQVCPLMETTYQSFFTRTWWSEHCDLGGVCPWEQNGLKLLQQAGDAFTRNQKASSQAPGSRQKASQASGAHRGSEGGTSSRGPRGHYRNDRDSRSRSPSCGNNGRRGGRNDYRNDRYDGGCRGGNNHGSRGRSFANADSSRSMGNTVAYQPNEPAPQSEDPVWRQSARKAMLATRMRLKKEFKQEAEQLEPEQSEPEPMKLEDQLMRLTVAHEERFLELEHQLVEMQLKFEQALKQQAQEIQQEIQQEVQQQMLHFFSRQMLQPQQPQQTQFVAPVPHQGEFHRLSSSRQPAVPAVSGQKTWPVPAASGQKKQPVPAASGQQTQQSADRSSKLEEDADAPDRPWPMRRRQETGIRDIGRPRDGRHD